MSHKGRCCKVFYTEDGCPYGDNCKFRHGEKSNARECVVINVVPKAAQGGGDDGGYAETGLSSNWNHKTKMCNKWETTGFCAFGSKCRFAHGSHELNKHPGEPVEPEGVGLVATAGEETPSRPSTQSSTVGVPPERLPVPYSFLKPRHMRRDGKLVKPAYGDWIDDVE